ncbi:MAG: sulfatase family protein, partial [Myxococcota bacterium]
MRCKRPASSALALLLLALAGCSPDAPPRNLVLISIDTLRADHLGAYGHPWVKTPAIDALAGESIRFDRVISAAPTTLASHTSLMTGTYPHRHGVPDNDYRVAEGNRMLAEVLSEGGFSTSGVVGGYPLGPQTRFHQGFGAYRVLPWDGVNSEEVSEAALDWLDARGSERFFLFVHYWDVHWPYSPPPPYDRMYRRDSLEMAGVKSEIDEVRRLLRSRAPDADARSDVLRRLYAGGVSYVDVQVGILLDGLRERGLLEDSLVVLTSDHGEMMDEHAAEFWNHGNSVYDAVSRVPLLLRLPGGAGGGRAEEWRLSNVDLMPTLLELLGLPVPQAIDGESFAGALLGREAWIGGQPIYAEATKPHDALHQAGRAWPNAEKCRAIWDDPWKLQHCPVRGRLELHDLAEDPGEQRNLLGPAGSASQREAGRRLGRQLATWSQSADPLETIAERSPEVIEQLRALGYVDDAAPEPGPRERVERLAPPTQDLDEFAAAGETRLAWVRSAP